MTKIAVLGIDLGKNVCSLVGFDEAGKVTLRRRMRREGLAAFAERLAPCVVAMEACCGAHWMGQFASKGHEVRLMSPEYVRTLRQSAEERRSRCGSHRRGGDTADHAFC